MQLQNKLFIGGEFVDAEAHGRIEVFNPHDNSKIADVAEAREADIDKAVAAATKAFPAWRGIAAADRGRLLLKLADAIEAQAERARASRDRSTPAIRSATRGCSTCRAPPRPSVTSAGWPTSSRAPGAGGAGLSQLRRARSARRGGTDRAVELSDHVYELEDGPGAGGGKLRGDEAGRADAAQLAQGGGADARGRLSARRGQYRARLRQRRRPVPRRASAGAEDRVHRIDRHRAQNRAGLVGQSEAACSSNSAARAPTSCSTTPTSTRRSTAARSPSSTTRARPVSPARG